MNEIRIKKFIFNDFQENTYVVYNKKGRAFIFDPGNSTPAEDQFLFDFISDQNLTPVALINTHCHIDHILGNKAVIDKYKIPFWAPDGEQMVLRSGKVTATMYGLSYQESPEPDIWIDPDHSITLDDDKKEEWILLSAPGHSPASMVFYMPKSRFAIAGDVLFRESIGRTDLPGGNHDLLLNNIREKLYSLPDDTVIYPGHGPETTIGYEKKNNPFVRSV